MIAHFTQHHNFGFLALAGFVCIVSMYSAAVMFSRSRAHHGLPSYLWLAGGATMVAWTAWATHFIAMIGFHSGFPARFDTALTLFSGLIVLAATWSGYGLMRRSPSYRHMLAGGVLIAVGISAMHYVGMAGYHVPAHFVWDPALIALSVVLGILLTCAGTMSYRVLTGRIRVLLTPMTLVLAILVIHSVGMMALTVAPIEGAVIAPAGMSKGMLTGLVAVVGAFVTVSAATAALLDMALSRRKLEMDARLSALAEELKESESRARLAERTKSEFLANMGHELRTPLNGVIGLTAVLKSTQLDEQQRSLAQNITESGEALRDIVDDVLDISQLEAGNINYEHKVFNPCAVIEKACAPFRDSAAAKNLTLIESSHADAPKEAYADPVRIRQVLVNMISNAVRFTPAGEVEVSVSTGAAPETGVETVVYEVRDTGIGIALSDHPIIFQPFRQVDNSATRGHGGAGLGLAICQNLVRGMGGDIEVESELGEGATFRFWIPARHDSMLVSATGDTARRDRRRNRLKILIVDNSRTDQFYLRALADRLFASVTLAATGQEALEILQSQKFDLIIINGQLPGLGGPGTISRIRRRESKTGELGSPILACVDERMLHVADDCRTAGANRAITKPIAVRAFFREVYRLTGEEAARRKAA